MRSLLSPATWLSAVFGGLAPNLPQHGAINTNIRSPLSPHWRRWVTV
jgi:hypothetical protein